MSRKPLTKPGKHGTLYLYRVTYHDSHDTLWSDVVRLWAYDEEHAEDRFLDAPDSEGWEVASIQRVTS